MTSSELAEIQGRHWNPVIIHDVDRTRSDVLKLIREVAGLKKEVKQLTSERNYWVHRNKLSVASRDSEIAIIRETLDAVLRKESQQ